MIKKIPVIETSNDDDWLYLELMDLLQQHKLLCGAAALNQTLKDHHILKLYLISKQIDKIRFIEETYFNDNGTLNSDQIEMTFADRQHKINTLQKLFNNL